VITNAVVDDKLSSPDSQKGKLQRIALDWLGEKKDRGETPTSLRFLFYELEQQGHVSKSPLRLDGLPKKRKADQDLIDAVTWLRDCGLIPWDWIVDESRSVHDWARADSVAAYVAQSVQYARIDPWRGTLLPVLTTESRGVGGVLARGVAQEYLAPVIPAGGMCRGYLVNEVVPLLEQRPCRVLYVGDKDLAGSHIEENTRRVLEHHLGQSIPWQRVALTDEQVEDLKTKGVQPICKKDRRYKDGRPHLAYEAEAIGQAVITRLVREALDNLLPEPLQDVLEREIQQRRDMKRLLERHMRRGR
jgi:hypothetical protein